MWSQCSVSEMQQMIEVLKRWSCILGRVVSTTINSERPVATYEHAWQAGLATAAITPIM